MMVVRATCSDSDYVEQKQREGKEGEKPVENEKRNTWKKKAKGKGRRKLLMANSV